MDLWNRFWYSCESLTTKTPCGLCGLIVIYTKQNLPLPGDCICCPPVFIGCEGVDDCCLMGTFPGAPLRLHHLHRWSPLPAEVSRSVHLNPGAPSHWHSSSVKSLDTTGRLQSCFGCSSQEDILGHLALSLPLDTLVWTLAPFSPTLLCPCPLPAFPTASLGSWEKA